MALQRRTKRPSDGPRGWDRNGGKAKRSKRRDPPRGVRAAGVRTFIAPTPFSRTERGAASKTASMGREVGSWMRDDSDDATELRQCRQGYTRRRGSRGGYPRSRMGRSVDLDGPHEVGAGQRRQGRQMVQRGGQGPPLRDPGSGVAQSRAEQGIGRGG